MVSVVMIMWLVCLGNTAVHVSEIIPEKKTRAKKPQNVVLFWGGDVDCIFMCRRCEQFTAVTCHSGD